MIKHYTYGYFLAYNGHLTSFAASSSNTKLRWKSLLLHQIIRRQKSSNFYRNGAELHINGDEDTKKASWANMS